MSEKQVQIKSKASLLYGVFSIPEDNPLHQLFISVHPFFEEKKSSHRVYVELARKLKPYGIGFLIFDLSGCGDSSGDLRDYDLDQWLSDIKNALNYVKDELKPEKIGLLGIRFGALLASQLQKSESIDSLIVIDPVLSGKKYFDELLKQKKVREMMTFGSCSGDYAEPEKLFADNSTIDLDGVGISKQAYESIVNNHFITENVPPHMMLIQISPKSSLTPDNQTLFDECKNNGTDIQSFCLTQPPFWKAVDVADSSALNDIIAPWLNKE